MKRVFAIERSRANDTAVQRRAREVAQRPMRPVACNGLLVGVSRAGTRLSAEDDLQAILVERRALVWIE
jgi:hypothetical protein